jgi:hypothetical protein
VLHQEWQRNRSHIRRHLHPIQKIHLMQAPTRSELLDKYVTNAVQCPIYQVNTDSHVQITWAFMLIQIPALCLVKLSFIYFYRRVFCTGTGPARIFEHIIITLTWIIIAWGISFFFAFLFICDVNFAAWWTSIKTLNTHCGKLLDLQLGFSVSDFITDFFLFVLPLPMVSWRFARG